MKVAMQTEFQMRVSFYPRNKKGSKGDSPIMMRVSLDGSRISLGQIGICAPPDMVSNNRVLPAHPNSSSLNASIDTLEKKVFFLAEQLHKKGDLTLEALREELNGKRSKAIYMSDLFEIEEKEMADKLSCKKVTLGTFRRHLCARKNFEDFISIKYRKKDLKVSEVTKAVIHDYEEYLGNVGYDRNTVVKYLILLKKPIMYAYNNELINRNPFAGERFPLKRSDRGYLTEDEIYLLTRTDLPTLRLDIVRDMFLFAVYTGLSYIDVRNLTENEIKLINGKKWILLDRQKTSKPCQILLLEQAEAIINKYSEYCCSGGRLLPLFSNQKVNAYLKEIAKLCGIKKNLTYHLARHTFATMALTKGMSIEAVSKVLGHSNIQTTQIYARITLNKIEEEMGLLGHRLNQEHFGL